MAVTTSQQNEILLHQVSQSANAGLFATSCALQKPDLQYGHVHIVSLCTRPR